MQQVLGNFRLALLVVPLLVLLVAFYAGFIGAQSTLLIVIFLVISAAVWDIRQECIVKNGAGFYCHQV